MGYDRGCPIYVQLGFKRLNFIQGVKYMYFFKLWDVCKIQSQVKIIHFYENIHIYNSTPTPSPPPMQLSQLIFICIYLKSFQQDCVWTLVRYCNHFISKFSFIFCYCMHHHNESLLLFPWFVSFLQHPPF